MLGLFERVIYTNPEGGDAANPISALLKGFKSTFSFIGFVTFFTETLALAPLFYIWNVFDRVVSSRSITTLMSLLIIMVILFIFWSGLDWVRDRLLIRVSMRLDWEVSGDVFQAAFRRFLSARNVDVYQTLADVMNLRNFLTGGHLQNLMSAPYAIIFIGAAAFFHWYLALFILIATTIQLLAAVYNSKVTGPVLQEATDSQAEARRVAVQSLRQSEVALALGMYDFLRLRWFRLHQKFLSIQVNVGEATGLMGSVSSFIGHIMPSLAIALAAYMVIQGDITGGMLLVAIGLLRRSIKPLKSIVLNWPAYQQTRQSLERLNRLLAEDEKWELRMPLPPPRPNLVVDSMSWQPEGRRKPVLSDISFELSAGKVLSIIGSSASGKTSLVKLLIGLYRPTSGYIRLDGAEVAPWLRAELGQHVGYVPQEIQMFEGTVAENIARMGPVDPVRVVDVTRMIGIHEAILTLENGYETILSENGTPLTGGQKQKVAIARALYNRPKYLVMDEPASSLDDQGILALTELIRVLAKEGTTVVFTTHRKGLNRVADYVLILKEGRIEAYQRRLKTKLKPSADAGEKSESSTRVAARKPDSAKTPSVIRTASIKKEVSIENNAGRDKIADKTDQKISNQGVTRPASAGSKTSADKP